MTKSPVTPFIEEVEVNVTLLVLERNLTIDQKMFANSLSFSYEMRSRAHSGGPRPSERKIMLTAM